MPALIMDEPHAADHMIPFYRECVNIKYDFQILANITRNSV